MSKPYKIPFILSSYGYKLESGPDDDGFVILASKRGKPFFNVRFHFDDKPSDGDQILVMLNRAYEEGYIDGVREARKKARQKPDGLQT